MLRLLLAGFGTVPWQYFHSGGYGTIGDAANHVPLTELPVRAVELRGPDPTTTIEDDRPLASGTGGVFNPRHYRI